MEFDFEKAKFAINKARFGLKKRISLYERLTAYLENGIDAVTSLKRIRKRYLASKDYRAGIIGDWLDTMEQGGKLSDALLEWVPPAEHMLISSGETGGGLNKGLREAVVVSVAASKMRAAIWAGAAYPLVLTIMLLGMLLMFRWEMVPVFETLLPVEAWTDSARLLNNIATFVEEHLTVVVLFFGVLFFCILKTLGAWRGEVRRKIFDKLPPWSIYQTQQGASFLISLASLLQANVSVFDALKLMHKTASNWMKEHLEMMMENMNLHGMPVGKALGTGLLDKETEGDVEDYGELGNFQDAIQKIGKDSVEVGVRSIEDKMSIVKNLMMFIVVGVLMWIYYSVFGLQTQIASNQGSPGVGVGSSAVISRFDSNNPKFDIDKDKKEIFITVDKN